MKYSSLFAVIVMSIFSCSDNCMTCKMTDPDGNKLEEEYCDEENTNYTDQNGAIISYEEFILQQEQSGYTCD